MAAPIAAHAHRADLTAAVRDARALLTALRAGGDTHAFIVVTGGAQGADALFAELHSASRGWPTIVCSFPGHVVAQHVRRACVNIVEIPVATLHATYDAELARVTSALQRRRPGSPEVRNLLLRNMAIAAHSEHVIAVGTLVARASGAALGIAGGTAYACTAFARSAAFMLRGGTLHFFDQASTKWKRWARSAVTSDACAWTDLPTGTQPPLPAGATIGCIGSREMTPAGSAAIRALFAGV